MFETNLGKFIFSAFAIFSIFLNGYLKESLALLSISTVFYFLLFLSSQKKHFRGEDKKNIEIAKLVTTCLGLLIILPSVWFAIFDERSWVIITYSMLAAGICIYRFKISHKTH